MSVQFVKYDPESMTLTIRFDGGEVYEYGMVPSDAGRAAETALTGGDHGYFRGHIRGIYPTKRVG